LIFGYCVRFAGDRPPAGVPGVDGRPVSLLEEAGLGLWYSHARVAAPDAEILRSYERVVLEALRSATPLPLRFGTRFPDEGEARDALRQRSEQLLGTLERVRGSVEMGVRVAERSGTPASSPAGEEPPPLSGRDYLTQKRRERREEDEQRRRAEAVLASVDALFAPAALQSAATAAAPPLIGTLAHLVPRGRLEQYRACAQHAIRLMPDLRIRISGPWAPYSFV
jgi:hypothetical protein